MQPLKPVYTRHAEVRLQQRGVLKEAVALLNTYADIERSGRGGAACLRLSHRAAEALLCEGAALAVVEQAASLECVVARDGALITVIRLGATRRTRVRRHTIRRQGRGR